MAESLHDIDWSTYETHHGEPSLPPRRFLVGIDTLKPKDYYHSLRTPVDERGLVDIPATIALVKGLVVTEYVWPEKVNVHHFFHPERWYPDMKERSNQHNPRVFYNLPIHKGLVPQQFHNLLHWALKPSKPPHKEVRSYRVEAWKVAHNLYKMAQETMAWEEKAEQRRQMVAANPTVLKPEFNGEDIIGEEVIQEIFDRNFQGLAEQFKRQSQLPEEFRLVEIDATPQHIAGQLGRVVSYGALRLVDTIAA